MTVKSCENDEDHGSEEYCDHCGTCGICNSEMHESHDKLILASMQQLERKNDRIKSLEKECESLKIDVKKARVTAEQSTHDQKAEIGHDAVMAYSKNMRKFVESSKSKGRLQMAVMLDYAALTSKEFAENLISKLH